MSNKLDACLLDIKNKSGKDLEKETQKELLDKISASINEFAVNGKTPTPAEILLNAQQKLQDAHYNKLKTAALNSASYFDNFNYIKTNYADRPGIGIATLFKDINADRQGARAGIYALENGLKQKYITSVNARLVEKDLLKLATSGTVEKEITEAVHGLNSGKDISHLPSEARDIAKILNDALDAARLEANKYGANIGKLDGYVQAQTHDQHKIGKAGGHTYGSAEAKAAWIKDIIDIGLDVKKTLGGASPEDALKILGSLYDQFANGYHLKFGEEADVSGRGLSSTAKKMSQDRKIYFNDWEATYNYNQKYGSEPTVYGGILSTLSSMSRNNAIMAKLGPSGILNLDKLSGELEKHFHELGEPSKVVEIKKNVDEIKRVIWPEMSGLNSIPVNALSADIGGMTRKSFEVGMLGGSMISSIPDATMAASAVSQFTTRDRKAFFGAINGLIKEVFNGLDKKESQQVASILGVYVDHVNPNSGVDASMKGKIGKASEIYYKLNLLTPWTQKVKLATAKYVSHAQALNIGKEFSKLPEGMQAGLRQFGITESEWGVVGKSQLFKDSQGREYINVKSFKDIELKCADSIGGVKEKINSINALDTIDADKKLKLIDTVRKDALDSLENKYTSMINEVAAIGATEPGVIEKAYMYGGTRRGTFLGEAVRSVAQFKSFTVSGMRKHLFRELQGYSTDIKSPGQALKDMVMGKDKQALAGFSSMIASGTVMGVLANSLKDITKGLEPRYPDDPVEFGKIMADGLVRSGGLGFYGDFLFGQVLENRQGQDPLTALLGPTAGFVSDTFKLAGSLKTSAVDGENFSKAQAIKYFKSYTPGVNTLNNHFATSYLANRLIFNKIQEGLNPGYLRKYEKSLKTNADKEFIRIESMGIDLSPSNDNIFNN